MTLPARAGASPAIDPGHVRSTVHDPDQGPYSSSIDGGTLLYLLPQGELGAASWPRAAPECWCYCSVLSIASSVGNCMMHPRQDWGQTLALGVDTCPDAR